MFEYLKSARLPNLCCTYKYLWRCCGSGPNDKVIRTIKEKAATVAVAVAVAVAAGEDYVDDDPKTTNKMCQRVRGHSSISWDQL